MDVDGHLASKLWDQVLENDKFPVQSGLDITRFQ